MRNISCWISIGQLWVDPVPYPDFCILLVPPQVFPILGKVLQCLFMTPPSTHILNLPLRRYCWETRPLEGAFGQERSRFALPFTWGHRRHSSLFTAMKSSLTKYQNSWDFNDLLSLRKMMDCFMLFLTYRLPAFCYNSNKRPKQTDTNVCLI